MKILEQQFIEKEFKERQIEKERKGMKPHTYEWTLQGYKDCIEISKKYPILNCEINIFAMLKGDRKYFWEELWFRFLIKLHTLTRTKK